jgi:Flp pilus assembly protein TadG
LLARAARSDERGVALLETALILPVFLMLVMGTIDLGRAVYIRTALANAARDGARFATVDPRNTSCIKTVAARYSSLANLTASDVTVTPPAVVDVGQPIRVAVQSIYTPVTPLIAAVIGGSSLTLRANATMQIRNVPSSSLACP